MRKSTLIFIFFVSSFSLQAQNIKYTFFDFAQDSMRSRLTQISMPTQGQTAGISNTLVTDYVGNTRLSISTAIIASKKDTFLAIHSLFNGIGNFTGELETPIFCIPFKHNNFNFLGMSLNPRVSTLINTGNMFEKSTLNLDVGFNILLKVQDDLGNLSSKLILRNALTWGNYQFIEKIYNIKSKAFYYSSFQIRLKAGQNVFIINAPIILIPINATEISGFPVYAGFGFNF